MSDPNFSSVTLLMHCDSLLDEISGQNATATGNAVVSTAQQKFGSGSLLFDGSGDYVSLPNSSNYNFGTGQFTVEGWVYLTSIGGYYIFFGQADAWFLCNYSGNILNFYGGGSWNSDYSWSPSTNTWYAVAADRDASNVLRVYLNGTMVTKNTGFTANITGTAAFTIGSGNRSGWKDMPGYVDEVRITKGVARYASDGGYTPSTTGFPQYIRSSTDNVGVNQADTPSLKYGVASADTVATSEATVFGKLITDTLLQALGVAEATPAGVATILTSGIGAAQTQLVTQIALATDTLTARDIQLSLARRLYSTLTETAGIAQTSAQTIGKVLADVVQMARTLTPNIKYATTLSDIQRIAESLSRGSPVSVTEAVGVAAALRSVTSVLTLERLGLTELTTPAMGYAVRTAEQAAASDALARFFGVDLSDTLGIAETIAAPAYKAGLLTETIAIAATLTPAFILRVTFAESLDVTAAQALQMIYGPVVQEGIEIAAGYVAPNGTFTTWAVNTRTGATTEYRNFEFNSFASRGHKYLGASSTGLYELNGDTDQGDDIVAHIKSGFAQFAGSRYTSFKAAYLGMRADGDVFLKVDAGDGATYTYQVVVQNMQTTKVRMGKGLRARYFSFELITSGQDFDLDSVEFVPIMAQRRV